MARVVTYQHAYIAGTTSLCHRHVDLPYPGTPTLGPLVRGAHEGECESCGVETMVRVAFGVRFTETPDARIERQIAEMVDGQIDADIATCTVRA